MSVINLRSMVIGFLSAGVGVFEPATPDPRRDTTAAIPPFSTSICRFLRVTPGVPWDS